VLNNGSTFVGGVAQVGNKPDRPALAARAVLHVTEVQGSPEIWWRFGGGSDRNRALLSTKGNSMQSMQIAQSRINTGDCASR
jgi:hypothetical protein